MTQAVGDVIRETSRHRQPGEKPAVCFIVQNQSFGGMEVHTLGLIQTLVERGHSIELVSNRYGGYDDVLRAPGLREAVRVIHSDLNGILYGERGDGDQWSKVLSGLQSRVLIFPKGDCNYGQLGFLRACRKHFTRIIFVEHLEGRPRPESSRRWLGVIPGLNLWWHKRRVLSRAGSRYADSIIAVSRSVRNRLVGDFGYAPGKVIVVHNAVPWQRHVRNEARGAAFRALHAIPTDAFVFGMLTRVEHQKGIDVALHALRRLVDATPSRRPFLVIAGDGSLLGALTELSSALGIEDRVKFVGFVRDPADVLSAYDVILFSSRNEGLPLALLEGMATGCIPVVTRISGMPEAINSVEVGRVVSPENPEELSTAMNSIMSLDNTTLARMKRAVVKRIEQDFDIAVSHRRILEACGLEGLA